VVNRGRVILILSLQIEKPRLREVKALAQGHTASECLSQDWPQGLSGKDSAFSRTFISLSHSLPFKGNWEFLLPLPSWLRSVPWHGWNLHWEGFPRKGFPEFAVPRDTRTGALRFVVILCLENRTLGDLGATLSFLKPRGGPSPCRAAGFALCVAVSTSPLVPGVLGAQFCPTGCNGPAEPWGCTAKAQGRGWMGRTQHWLHGSLVPLADPLCSSGQVSQPSKAPSVPLGMRRPGCSAGARRPSPNTARFKVTK